MRKEVVQWHTLTHSLTFSIRVLDGEREREVEGREEDGRSR